MKLPEHLKKKREDIVTEYSDVIKNGVNQRKIFRSGFNSACEELLPIIERMEKYFERPAVDMRICQFIGKAPTSDMIKDVEDLLEELKKWRES